MNIYRLENVETMHGMWYREDGTFDPFIKRLTDGKSADLPMEFDLRYYDGGTKWFSGCGSVDKMRQWFSAQDAVELLQNGYGLYLFNSSSFKVEEHQVLFTREGVSSRVEIPLSEIWSI